MSLRRLGEAAAPARVAGGVRLALALALGLPTVVGAQPTERDRLDITGQQNLTLGSGARAFGMGGAFLARADDATAASWNPAGLSYLRLPEVSLGAAATSYTADGTLEAEGYLSPMKSAFDGWSADFAALTWPVAIRGVQGAIQISYQRAISFYGTREVREESRGLTDQGRSDGGFDILAFGTGVSLGRNLRAGVAVNRWFNGYTQTINRTLEGRTNPYREFDLEFRPRGWNFHLGLMWSPWEPLNLGAVYKTSFTAGVTLSKARRDTWHSIYEVGTYEITTNAHSSEDVQLEFPSAFGFGVSWRPRETLTLSADLTLTRWSEARILNYFILDRVGRRDEDGNDQPTPDPDFYPPLQFPTLVDAQDPGPLGSQQDKQEIRLGAEWVLIRGAFRIPLRAGYFSDGQIQLDADDKTPRFNGLTAGVGVAFGSVLFDVAYMYEFGRYDSPVAEPEDYGPGDSVSFRNTLHAHRAFASVIYRFGGHP